MQRYFFDLYEGGIATLDDEGQLLPSRATLVAEIKKILLDVAEDDGDNRGEIDIELHVRDETGHEISTARLTLRNSWTDA
jgi:hypothetical protein